MSKIELGRVGAAFGPGDSPTFVETAAELDRLGYATIWLAGGQVSDLGQIRDVVRGTHRARVAGGIISVDRFDASAVADLYTEVEASHPGRFVVGLGGAHGPKPFETLAAYLDRLEGVPRERIIMAALGPRMLELARTRAAGAYPVLVTPAYTARARRTMGDDTTLAVDQLVVLDTDPGRARQTARGPLGFMGSLPAYRASFRRMGFADEEIEPRSDRLVDALVAWGDADAIAAQVDAQLAAGADHVAVSLVTDASDNAALEQWRTIAGALFG